MKHALKILTPFALTPLFASNAFAHAGHLHEAAGHSHYIALAAVGAVIGGLAIFGLIKTVKIFKNHKDVKRETAV